MKGCTSYTKTLAMVGALLAGTVALGDTAYAGHQSVWSEPVILDFRQVDTDADNSISLQEFKAQIGDERAFSAADLNNDGRLDRSEYFAARSVAEHTKGAAYFDDTWITAKVKAVLLNDDFLSGLEIHVQTRDGVVQLSGFVRKPEQIGRAIYIASRVEGVKQVQNDLILKGAGPPPSASGSGSFPWTEGFTA
jgi:hyperosmotically inducible protein